jgi:hypothetical protein
VRQAGQTLQISFALCSVHEFSHAFAQLLYRYQRMCQGMSVIKAQVRIYRQRPFYSHTATGYIEEDSLSHVVSDNECPMRRLLKRSHHEARTDDFLATATLERIELIINLHRHYTAFTCRIPSMTALAEQDQVWSRQNNADYETYVTKEEYVCGCSLTKNI